MNFSRASATFLLVKSRFFKILRPQCNEGAFQEERGPDAIFIWLPKTAGTSLWSLLEAKGGRSLHAINVETHNDTAINSGIMTYGHFSAEYLISNGIIDPTYYKSAWKFAICRNPYDRAVSLYEYLKLTGDLPKPTTFSIFCRYLAEGAFIPVGAYNHRDLNQLNPQMAWLRNDTGEISADFIGRFENIEQDLKVIGEKLGFSTDDLPHLNRSSNKGYKSYYSSREIDIVKSVYKEDFECLGYSFDIDSK